MTFVTHSPESSQARRGTKVSIPYGEYDLRHPTTFIMFAIAGFAVSIPYGEYDLRHKTVIAPLIGLKAWFPSPTGNMTFVTHRTDSRRLQVLFVSIPYGEYDLRHFWWYA